MPIILDGTAGITTPEIVSTGGPLVVNASAPDNSVVVNASGNVGIGTSSPNTAYRFTINGVGTAGNPLGGILFRQGAVDVAWLGSVARDNDTDVEFWNPRNGYMRFATNNTERMRITPEGDVLVGETASSARFTSTITTTNRYAGYFNFVSGGYGVGIRNVSGGSATLMYFFSPNYVGEISTSGSTTSYSSASDYRLKHDIAPMTGALAKVAQLKPVTYKWNVDDSNGEGFIAHELAEVCPSAVTGEKDAVETYTDEDGVEQTRIKPQGIDTSFLVATLTAAIQEQQAIIESLTARVVALENQIV